MNQEKEDTNLELHHAIAQEARLYMAELRSKHSSTAWKLVSLKDLDKATEIADPERYRLIDLIVQYATEGGLSTDKWNSIISWLYGQTNLQVNSVTEESPTEELSTSGKGRHVSKTTTSSSELVSGPRTLSLQQILAKKPNEIAEMLRRFVDLNETALRFADHGDKFVAELFERSMMTYYVFRSLVRLYTYNRFDLGGYVNDPGMNRKLYMLDQIWESTQKTTARNYIQAKLPPELRTKLIKDDGSLNTDALQAILSDPKEGGKSYVLELKSILSIYKPDQVPRRLRKLRRYNNEDIEGWRKGYALNLFILANMDTRLSARNSTKVSALHLDIPYDDAIAMRYLHNFVPDGIALFPLRFPGHGMHVMWYAHGDPETDITPEVHQRVAEAGQAELDKLRDLWSSDRLCDENGTLSLTALSKAMGIVYSRKELNNVNYDKLQEQRQEYLAQFNKWVLPPKNAYVDSSIMQRYGVECIEFRRTPERMIEGDIAWPGSYYIPFKIHDDGTVLLPAGLSEYAFFTIEQLITMHLAKYQKGYVEANYQYVKDLRAEGKTITDMEDVDRLLRMTMTPERAEAMEAKNRELLPLALGGIRSIKDAETFIETARQSEEYALGINGISYRNEPSGDVSGYVDVLGKRLEFTINQEGVTLDDNVRLSHESVTNIQSVILYYLSEFRGGDAEFMYEDVGAKTEAGTMRTDTEGRDVVRITHLRSLKLGQVPHESNVPRNGVTLNDLAKEHFGYTLDEINTELIKVMYDVAYQQELEDRDPVLAGIVAIMLVRIIGKPYRDLGFIETDTAESPLTYRLVVSEAMDGSVLDSPKRPDTYTARFERYLYNLGFNLEFVEKYKRNSCPQALVTLVPAVGRFDRRVIKGMPPRPEVEAPSLTSDSPQPHVPRG